MSLIFNSTKRPLGWCRRIRIENLPKNTTDEQIYQFFQKSCGEIETIVRENNNNDILITFFYLHSADTAVLLNKQREFLDNDVTIEYAQHDSDRDDGLEMRSMINQIRLDENCIRKNPICFYLNIYGIIVAFITFLLLIYIILQQENNILVRFFNNLRDEFNNLNETPCVLQNRLNM